MVHSADPHPIKRVQHLTPAAVSRVGIPQRKGRPEAVLSISYPPKPRATPRNAARQPEWLLGDPLGGDGITSWEGFFYGFVDQLLLALIQIFTRNPVTRCAVGGPVWIGLSRAAFLLRVRSSLIRHDSLLKLWHRTRMLPGNG